MKRFFSRKFWPGSAFRSWLGRRFTKAGALAIAGLLMTGGLAMDSEQSLAYQTFALLFCLLLVAFVFSFSFRARFSVQRRLPRFGTVGVPVRYSVFVENKTLKVQRGLALLEDLADPRHQPAMENASVLFEWGFLRILRNPRKLHCLAKAEETSVPSLAPHSGGLADATIIPLRRGMLRFKGVILARPDPLGLFRSFVRIPLPQSLAILPKRYLVSPFALPGSTKYQPGGVAMASSIGESEEFVSLRDYRRGDPMRHIHWKSWAKTGKPIVKEFQDEFFVRHALILDTFAGADKLDLFEEAVSVAASFAYTINTQESLLDLMFVGSEAFCFTAGRGVAHMEQMLEILAAVQLCPGKRFKTLHDLVLRHAALLSGCICIFLEWDASRHELVRNLQVLGVPLLILVLVEPGGAKKISRPSDISTSFHLIERDKVQEGLLNL